MDSIKYIDWNRVVYFVSDIYRLTQRFRPGDPAFLRDKIRSTAVNVTAGLNGISEAGNGMNTDDRIYSVISSVSVLETYLQLARQYGLLKDNSLLNGELQELKRILSGLLNSQTTGNPNS